MKERPILFSGPMVRAILEGRKTQTRRIVKPQPVETEWRRIACPYGQPGDRLWVKETFATKQVKGLTIASTKPNDPEAEMLARATHRFRAYRADQWENDEVPEGMTWRPSIYMPRWASRLTLAIVRVRVERLQDITEEDAIAEGSQEPALVPIVGACLTERAVYAKLWEAINGAGSWALNPWVWVVEFKRVEREETRGRGDAEREERAR